MRSWCFPLLDWNLTIEGRNMISVGGWILVVGIQGILAGFLATWWSGWYAVHREGDQSGWGLVLVGTVGALGWIFLILHFGEDDLLNLVLALGVTLVSIPIYRLYEEEHTRVFVRWGLAVAFSSLFAAFAVWLTIDTGLIGGYVGLVLSLGVSATLTWLARRRALRTWRNRFMSPPKRTVQRDLGCLTSIGTVIGISLAAMTYSLREQLPPELQAGVTSFIIGCLGFALLGIFGWVLVWEIKKRRRRLG